MNADIKAQVSGYLLKQDYTEGSFVQKGNCYLKSIPGLSRRWSIKVKASSRRPTGS